MAEPPPQPDPVPREPLSPAAAGDEAVSGDGLTSDQFHNDSSFERAIQNAVSGAFDSAFHPEQIGRYRILEPLRPGGMGAVFKAEQRDDLRRLVALKIVKPGFDTREVMARFNTERQVLARMDHPNIAKVLDAGATDQGRPFFVMEFVPGKPVTEFCDENRLSLADRLRLFRQACDAITHAHTKGIIHRDIKPSNVLAYQQDGNPTVKVIDFGIAKALTGDHIAGENAGTFFTATDQPIGTYDSMSPEQAEGSPDIDTKTDVYSLGVLLYELLTGVKPFDTEAMARTPPAERRKMIREVQPARPSTRLMQLDPTWAARIAECREQKVNDLCRQLRRDLEWIPLKAMRKERARRYATPAEMSDDIGRFLAGRPLLAAPESQAYRLRKFLQRNRGPVIAVGCVLLAIVAGFVIAGLALVRESRQRAEAERQRANAERAIAFMVELFEGARPTPDGRQITAVDLVLTAVERLRLSWTDQPEVRALYQSRLGVVLYKMDRTNDALPLLQEAMETRRAILGVNHRDTLASMADYAMALRDETGMVGAAASIAKEAADRATRAYGDTDPLTLDAKNAYAVVLEQQEKYEDAERYALQVLRERQRTLPADDPELLKSLSNYASILSSLNRMADAERIYREVLTVRSRTLGVKDPATITTEGNLAVLLSKQRRYSEAQFHFNNVVNNRKAAQGPGHRDTILAMADAAFGYLDLEMESDARLLFHEAINRAAECPALGPDHEETRHMVQWYARLLERSGRPAESAAIRAKYGLGGRSTSTAPATAPADR